MWVSVDYNTNDVSDVVDINNLIKKTYKIMFKLIKQTSIVLLSLGGSLSHIAKASDCTKGIFLNNQPCLVGPTLFWFKFKCTSLILIYGWLR